MKIPRWLRNKYVLTTAGFLVWMMFFNNIDIPFLLECRSELSELRAQRNDLVQKNETAKETLHLLSTDKENLERFAREEYYMKRENETIFIIKEREPGE